MLVTELSPGDFIYGKLYGILYNAKEMVLLPLLAAIYLWWTGRLSGENTFFFVIDFLLFCHFAAMLGLHSAITYTSSRTAVANSLGTIFFLMVGILICAFLIIQSDQEFGRQLLSFMIFIGAGSVALFGSLGAKNPSRAIALVALLTPFWTFYCIISLIHGDFLAAFLFSAGIYGFALWPCSCPPWVISTSPWDAPARFRDKRDRTEAQTRARRTAMRSEDVREFLRRQPFQPFRLTLTDGRNYDVMHPELALLGRNVVAVGLVRPGAPEDVADRIVHWTCSTLCRSRTSKRQILPLHPDS